VLRAGETAGRELFTASLQPFAQLPGCSTGVVHNHPVQGAGVAPGDTADQLFRAILKFMRVRIFVRKMPGKFLIHIKRILMQVEFNCDVNEQCPRGIL
jgi:hypothetical protein